MVQRAKPHATFLMHHNGRDRPRKRFSFQTLCCCPTAAWPQIPVCKDVHNEHDNVLNLVFRLIMPEVLTFLAVLFTRFWPTSIVSTLQATEVR